MDSTPMTGGRKPPGSAGPPPKQKAVAEPSERYYIFLATSLVLALGLGFVLAILLPIAVALQSNWGLRWQALAQVHGHVQVVGFAGFFVIGMAYRLVPRFSSTPLRHGWTVLPVYGLLLAGVILRALTQPLSDNALFAWGQGLASFCELAGAALFCLSMVSTLRRPLIERQPWAPFIASGAIWFALQALLGAWVLTDLSLHGSSINALPGGRTVLPASRDDLLLTLQIYGFLLGFIFGVAGRAVPTFFGHRPPARLVFTSWALLQVGTLLFAGESVLQVASGSSIPRLQATGLLCLGAALIAGAATTGSWKPASRLRPSARSAAGLVKAAFLWCAVAGVLDIAFGLQTLLQNEPLSGDEADAVRHVLAVGVITTIIFGMGHLVVPALATQRLAGVTDRRRLAALQVLLACAVVLRAVPPLLTGLDTRLRFSLVGVAGVLAWLAIALFGYFLWKARGQQEAIVAEATQATRGRPSGPETLGG